MTPVTTAADARLQRWLRSRVSGLEEPIELTRFPGGQSNPTFKVTSGERALVLRAKPSGTLLPSAHAIGREYRVLRALEPTAIPVPSCFGYCADVSVLGAEFFVMAFVPGRLFTDPALPDATSPERSAVHAGLATTLAELHALDPVVLGLADFAGPVHYLQRQLRRWSGQYRLGAGGPIPAMDELIERLPEALPAGTERRLLHGDFRIDNVLIATDGPDPLGVLDWELSTLGDPLADLAHHVLPWVLPRSLYRFGIADSAAPGLPSLTEQLDTYLRASGRTQLPDWDAYLAFALFRLAAILHGISSRAMTGTAASPSARTAGERAAAIAEIGWQRLASA